MSEKIKKELIEILNSISADYIEPYIIYSRKIMKLIVQEIIDILNECGNVKCLYSVKANLNDHVISYLSEFVDGFDVASWEEYTHVSGYNKIVSASGYAFTHGQIQEIVKSHQFDFISINQLQNVCKTMDCRDIAIRINGYISKLEDNKKRRSRFGCLYETDCQCIKNICKVYNLRLTRLHIHLGQKDNNNINNIIEELKRWCKSFDSISQINIGGGWDYLYDMGLFSENVKKIAQLFRDKQIYIEPGSLLVRKSGILVSRVADYCINLQKQGNVMLDVSAFNLSSWYVPKIIANIHRGEIIPFSEYNVCGNTCFESDIFQVKQKRKIGAHDIVCLYPVGAYFNSTYRKLHNIAFPKEILI